MACFAGHAAIGSDRVAYPLPRNAHPKVTITPVGFEKMAKTVEMTERPGQLEWNGWFSLRYPVKSPGEYKIALSPWGCSRPITSPTTRAHFTWPRSGRMPMSFSV